MNKAVNHRERLERCLVGDQADRVPVALWRHFPVDDQYPARLVSATINFQRTFDFDFVKVSPASSFCIKDWGAKDEWQGAPEGTREYTLRVIQEPQDWLRLTVLDPNEGHLAQQISSLQMIIDALGPDTPVIQTVFSPLAQAKNLVAKDKLLVHLRKYPDEVSEGLATIAQSTQRFIEVIRETGIAGVFYAVQHAQHGLLTEEEFRKFGSKFDLKVLEPVSDLWLNVVHIHGEDVMFAEVSDYPAAVLNWHDRDTPPSLNEGQDRFSGVVCGGLRREDTIVLGTPEQVISEAREAIEATGGRRFILGTGCVVPTIAPWGNIMAARESVEQG